jgi:hypothetical protein
MNAFQTLTAIEVQIKDEHLAVPSGMVPRHAHPDGRRWIVHVEGWTGAGEFDNDRYDLYSIDELPQVTITVGSCDLGRHDEQWYGFGKPARKAIKVNGELIWTEEP